MAQNARAPDRLHGTKERGRGEHRERERERERERDRERESERASEREREHRRRRECEEWAGRDGVESGSDEGGRMAHCSSVVRFSLLFSLSHNKCCPCPPFMDAKSHLAPTAISLPSPLSLPFFALLGPDAALRGRFQSGAEAAEVSRPPAPARPLNAPWEAQTKREIYACAAPSGSVGLVCLKPLYFLQHSSFCTTFYNL